MKRILLHVGTHKTGSTSLQRTLFLNQERLKEAGVAYLGGERAYPNLYSAFLENPMAFEWNKLSGLSKDEIIARDKNTLATLGDDIRNSTCDTIILSSEFLAMLPHKCLVSLKNFLEQFGDVTAIYFYRELLSWMASDTQQMAKVGFATRPTEYKVGIQRVYDMPLRVYQVFGDAGSCFVKFEDAAKQGICNSIFTRFDIPTLEELGLTEERVNEGISETAVRLMFLYNHLFPRGSGNRNPKVVDRIHALDGARYMLSGITKRNRDDYRRKRKEMREQLGLELIAANNIPISQNPDLASTLLLDMAKKHATLGTAQLEQLIEER